MTTGYGVSSKGFARKPLAAIKADMEALARTEFGNDAILSPQSPLGQIIGTIADAASEVWEFGEATFQAWDVDQAEGLQLDVAAQARGLQRAGRTDGDFRAAIKNTARTNIVLADIEEAVRAVPGVTYVHATDDGDALARVAAPDGAIAVAVIGGQDADVGQAMHRYLPAGSLLYGNAAVEVEVNGRCRSLYVLRPVEVPVGAALTVTVHRDRSGCAPPTSSEIAAVVAAGWQAERINGRDVTPHGLRRQVEAVFDQIEVAGATAFRLDGTGGTRTPEIQFAEIATLSADDVAVTFA